MLTLIWCPFHPALPQWHVKDPGHSAKSVGGRLYLNRRSGLTMLFRYSVGTSQGNKLTCNSTGNTQPQSSKLTKPLWTLVKSGICVHNLFSTLYISKKCRWKLIHQKSSHKSSCVRKKTPPLLTMAILLEQRYLRQKHSCRGPPEFRNQTDCRQVVFLTSSQPCRHVLEP